MSPEITRVAVTMHVRFPLSQWNVKELLYERGIDASHETVRCRWHRFGPMFAAEIRKRRIDGCTHFSAFWRITLPLSAPGLASCGAIVFFISWRELLISLILNSRAEFMTLPVVIASLVGDVHAFFNLMMAICLLAMLPSVILTLLLQRFVVRCLQVGGVKG